MVSRPSAFAHEALNCWK